MKKIHLKLYSIFLLIVIVSKACCKEPECLTCIKSESIVFYHHDIPVNATITLPDRKGKFPAIIISPGSGKVDRNLTRKYYNSEDNCLYPMLLNSTITPYKDLAESLSSKGYIVLRYDKPQYTFPLSAGFTGEKNFDRIWLATVSAIEYLKTRPEVDASAIILAGHSEGSYLIPYIARNRDDIRALISLAGPFSPIDSLVAYQMAYLKNHCFFPGYDYDGEGNRWLNYFSRLRSDLWDSKTPDFDYVPAAAWHDYVHVIDNSYEAYNSCNLPSLFIAFYQDWNVPPEQQERFKKAIKIPADFRMFNGMMHMMVFTNSPHVPESLTDTISSWLKRKVL